MLANWGIISCMADPVWRCRTDSMCMQCSHCGMWHSQSGFSSFWLENCVVTNVAIRLTPNLRLGVPYWSMTTLTSLDPGIEDLGFISLPCLISMAAEWGGRFSALGNELERQREWWEATIWCWWSHNSATEAVDRSCWHTHSAWSGQGWSLPVFGSSETRSSWIMKTWRKPDKRKSTRLGNGLGRNQNY